jgi:anaerobic ribonucleoside-triphosphate reductase activating protein
MSPTSATLRLHYFLPSSRANGPGVRAVLWVQGCTLGCPGCFNPETHPSSSGKEVKIAELFNSILNFQSSIEGITVSGGEPLQQLQPLLSLFTLIRSETTLSIIIFTGFEWTEMERIPRFSDLAKLVDVIIAGRFDKNKRLARGLLGSSNKTIHLLSTRYRDANFREVPQAEILIGSGGEVVLTGIDPLIF